MSSNDFYWFLVIAMVLSAAIGAIVARLMH